MTAGPHAGEHMIICCGPSNPYNRPFIEPNEEPERAKVGEMLHAALEHLEANRDTGAVDALSRAFEQHLDEFLRLREEMIPYGTKVNRMFLFTWAGRRRLFPRLTWTLLRRAEPYLLGTVPLEHFDSAAFASAARLFLRLRVDFLLRRREHSKTQIFVVAGSTFRTMGCSCRRV